MNRYREILAITLGFLLLVGCGGNFNGLTEDSRSSQGSKSSDQKADSGEREQVGQGAYLAEIDASDDFNDLTEADLKELEMEKQKDEEGAKDEEDGDDDSDKAKGKDKEKDEHANSSEEARLCKKELVDADNFIHIKSKKSTVKFDAQDSLILKISGSENRAEVNIAGQLSGDDDETPHFRALCLFLSGNQSSADIKISAVNVDKIFLKSRGNKASVNIDVAESAGVSDFSVNMAGNSGSVRISGGGNYVCPEGNLKGNNPSIECVKD